MTHCFAVADLDGFMSRNTTFALYYEAKELICCDGAHAAQILFACWTSIAAIASTFALLCLWKVVSHTLDTRKESMKGTEGAAVSPVEGGDEIITAPRDDVAETPATSVTLPVDSNTQENPLNSALS